jgi:transketolase
MNSIVLRDALIEEIYERMAVDESIFFISADFGAPALDKLREKFVDRFINVGIAEQNLVNIATGLALEGFKVYAYAIAPFLTMRAYEQIRTSISILSQVKKININLIGVGAGLSYDVTGPTHHCLEDNCIMNVLPGITIFSPSDAFLVRKFVDYTLKKSGPKYIRLDGKAQPQIYTDDSNISFENGFSELKKGKDVCIISTGYMTHIGLKIEKLLAMKNINAGIIDVYLLKPFNDKMILDILKDYQHIVTMEESFLNKGSLDSIIERICFHQGLSPGMSKFGFDDKYVFEVGNREHLYKVNNLDPESMVSKIMDDLTKC